MQPKNPHIKLISIRVNRLPESCWVCDFMMDAHRTNPDLDPSPVCRITGLPIYEDLVGRASWCPLTTQNVPDIDQKTGQKTGQKASKITEIRKL